MGIRLKGKVATTFNNVYTVEILDTQQTGGTLEVELRTPGFSLEYHGGEDIFTPLIPSTCTIPLVITTSTIESFLIDLQTAEENRFRVRIRSGGEDDDPIFWVGTITTDNISTIDGPFPYDAEVTAVDGLQLLSRRKYVPAATNSSYLTHTIDILKLIGTSDLFETGGVDEVFLKTFITAEPDVATLNDNLTDVKLTGKFYDLTTQTFTAFEYDAEVFLTNLLRAYNCRIVQTEGAYFIVSISKYLDSAITTVNVRRFFADETETSVENTSFVRLLSPTVNRYRLSYWRTNLKPPIREVTRPLNYGSGLIVTNQPGGNTAVYPSGASNTPSTASYQINENHTYPVGTRFQITGVAEIQTAVTSTTEPTGKLRFVVEFRIGTYYLRRMNVELVSGVVTTIPADEFSNVGDQEVQEWDTPEEAQWTNTSSDVLQFGSELINYDAYSPYATVPTVDVPINIGFTTPPLPAEVTGTLRIAFRSGLFKGDGGAPTQTLKNGTPVFISFRLSAENGNSSGVIYKAINSNNASETVEEDPVYFGTKLISGGEYQYNPSEFFNGNGSLPNWVTPYETTGKGLHQIAVNDIARYRVNAVEIFTGTLVSQNAFATYIACYYDNVTGKIYVQVNTKYEADTETYSLELHVCGFAPSTNPTEEVVLINDGVKPPSNTAGEVSLIQKSTRRFVRLTSEQIADIETDVAEVRATSDASGGKSVVLLQYLGDVKISGPLDGQILEYNSLAGRWNNVAPSAGGSPLSASNQTIAQGVTRDIILNGSVANNTYFRIVDSAGTVIFSIQNYGTILNIIEYYGLIAYRSTATAPGSIAIYEPAASGVNFVQIKSPALAANIILTLPPTTGTAGQALVTDGSGALSFSDTPALLPLQNISGRWQWSSADAGERVLTGSTAYGPFNWYSHSNEPNTTTIRVYSAAHVIGTTSGFMPAYYLPAFGVPIPTDSRKVRVDFNFRVQNAPTGSTWGVSLWGADAPADGTTSSIEFTLRGVSADVTTTTTSSVAFYSGTVTTPAAITETHILPMFENRTGSLTTTCYIYGQLSIYLVA